MGAAKNCAGLPQQARAGLMRAWSQSSKSGTQRFSGCRRTTARASVTRSRLTAPGEHARLKKNVRKLRTLTAAKA
jgi:hypothetical protein